jgi:hypothetical protein
VSKEPIFRHLTDDGLAGDGTNFLANVNGSVTPVPFWYGPASTERTAVHRLIVEIEDNATITADNYGGVSALTNGITVKVIQGNESTGVVVTDLLDGDPIKNHVNWAAHCYDVTEHTYGSGNNFVVVRWTFAKSGRPLILDGRINEKLVVTVNDDLSTLVDHQFQIQGHTIGEDGHQLESWGV